MTLQEPPKGITNIEAAIQDLVQEEGISRLLALAVLLDGTHPIQDLRISVESVLRAPPDREVEDLDTRLEYMTFWAFSHDQLFIPDHWLQFSTN